MSKRNKVVRKNINKQTNESPIGIFIESLLKNKWFGIGLIVIVLSIMFFKIGFLHYEPEAPDTNQWRKSAYDVIKYNEEHSDPALWNSNIFGGMPNYLISFPYKYPFTNTIINTIHSVVSWKLTYLILGALGIFFLLRFLKMNNLVASICGLAFSLSSHYVALLDMGHNTKFQAIMILPWVLYSFIYLKEKRNLLGLGFFAVSLISELRANHLQITYYMFLFLGVFWIYELVLAIKNKTIKAHGLFTILLLIGFTLSALAVANPHLSNFEYSKYSMRGGEGGLEKGYAQSWSMHPAEFVEFLFPDFFGGISTQGSGKSYWGWMQFTQAYHYTGVIILLLGVLAFFYSKSKYAKILWLGVVLAMIMSMGRHFPLVSNFLHDHLPGFNKFRVPATHLVIMQILMIVLSALGFKEVLNKKDDEKFNKIMKICFFSFVGLFFINLVAGSTIFKDMAFMGAPEIERYAEYANENNIDVNQFMNSPQFQDHIRPIKAERLKLLTDSVSMGLFLLAAGFGLIFFYTKKMISKNVFILIIGVFIIYDLSHVNSAYFKKLYPHKDSTEIAMNSIDKYLLDNNAKGTYRVHVLDNMDDVTWASYNQMTGGYHGAKLQRIEDLRKNALNFNSINMLNARYLITRDAQYASNFNAVASVGSGDNKQYLVPNMGAMDRAWFVKQLLVKEDKEDRLSFLGSKSFDPAYTAILEESIEMDTKLGHGIVEQIPQEDYHHKVAFNIKNLEKDGFLVVSEIYYPKGWKAYADGKEIPIYPVNHILRGVKVPANTQKIEMVFAPESYKLSKNLSLIGLVISTLMLIAGIFINKKKNKLDVI